MIGLEATQTLAPTNDRAFAGETVSYERALVDAIGRTRWIRGRMVPDLRFDGAIQGVYVVGHDITDLKDAQDALAARESQLARSWTACRRRSPTSTATSAATTSTARSSSTSA